MLDISGLCAIIVFYLLILAVGMWAARKGKGNDTEDVMLAGRSIGVFVGIFTMTATWVGGGYINGTAEMLYTSGLVWCQVGVAPFGYSLSLVLGGVLFAEKMRQQGYVTMLDPFQKKYGERVGGIMFIPALCGEVFWSAAILSALGATLAVILNIPNNASVIISACIAVFYTFFGGLYAVAYTDVVQLVCIFVGLWICIPYGLYSEYTGDITANADQWVGELNGIHIWCQWIDSGLLLIFGGIPWQVYFQRVLSSKDPIRAKMLSYVAAIGCIVMAVPPVLIAWNATNFRPYPNDTVVFDVPEGMTNMVLPLVLQHLTPSWVSFIGLGAVSAAVMSSADSSILSAASMFARNIWKLSIRPSASEFEVLWVMRVNIILVGVLATVMALVIQSIYGLWYLCADLVYVILFPQLLTVVYVPWANTYGSLSGYFVGFILRMVGGEPLVGLTAWVQFPMYDPATNIQYFPFRSLAMCCSLATILFVSYLTDQLFLNKLLPARYDFMHAVLSQQCCFEDDGDAMPLPIPTDGQSIPSSCDTLAMNNVKATGKQSVGVEGAQLIGGGKKGAGPGGENGMSNPLLSQTATPNSPAPRYEDLSPMATVTATNERQALNSGGPRHGAYHGYSRFGGHSFI